MREACLIMKNHLNDDIKTLKSKEVVRSCMLLQTILSFILNTWLLEPNYFRLMKTVGLILLFRDICSTCKH